MTQSVGLPLPMTSPQLSALVDGIRSRLIQQLPPPASSRLSGVALAQAVGIEPDDWQADLLCSTADQLILNCSRQAGKSTVSGILALEVATYTPSALVLILAPALRQAQELFRKIKLFHGRLGARAVPIVRESALELELSNGARIACLPGKDATVRGFSAVALLIVDEAARAPDDLYQSLRPMLAVSRGRLVLLSTPFGARGFFHHEWTEGGPEWHRVEIHATDVPRIDPLWLAHERASIGEWWYSQEYDCQFVASTDSVFSYDLVMAGRRNDIEPLFPFEIDAPTEEDGPWNLFS